MAQFQFHSIERIFLKLENKMKFDVILFSSFKLVKQYRNCEVIWNISYIELQMWSQVSFDPRKYERNLCNCECRGLKNSGLQRGLKQWPRDTVELTKINLKYSLYLRSFYGRLKLFHIQCELKLFASRCYQTNSRNKLKLSLSQSSSHNLVLDTLPWYSFFCVFKF